MINIAALRIASCHQHGASRAADYMGISLREAHACFCQLIHGGSVKILRTIAINIERALIVRKEQDHVGSFLIRICTDQLLGAAAANRNSRKTGNLQKISSTKIRTSYNDLHVLISSFHQVWCVRVDGSDFGISVAAVGFWRRRTFIENPLKHFAGCRRIFVLLGCFYYLFFQQIGGHII